MNFSLTRLIKPSLATTQPFNVKAQLKIIKQNKPKNTINITTTTDITAEMKTGMIGRLMNGIPCSSCGK